MATFRTKQRSVILSEEPAAGDESKDPYSRDDLPVMHGPKLTNALTPPFCVSH